MGKLVKEGLVRSPVASSGSADRFLGVGGGGTP